MTQPEDPKTPDSQAPGAAEGPEAGASRRMPAGASAHPVSAPEAPSRRYSNYVLGVLVLVYVFNFIDRQILSILAEDIRNDLGIDDAQLGFLYGTAFAVFYAIFGIPIGRLADMWTRKSLISVGLAAWSLMTALSGTARGFASLAAYRIGVGIGESSAGPAAFSMLGGLLPAPSAGHGHRDVLERRLHRRRPRHPDRRPDRGQME